MLFTSEENRRNLLTQLPAEELRQLLLTLQQATGQTAAVYTPDGFLVSSSGWMELCESCKDYSHQFQLENSCWSTHGRSADWLAAIEAEEVQLFQCRRGPCDLRIPIKWDGQWVGTLVVGRFGLSENLPLPGEPALIGGCFSTERFDQLKAMIWLVAKQIKHMLHQAYPSSRLVKNIVETLSHELRSPLSGIIGMSELIRLSLPQTPAMADTLEMIDLMDDAGQSLLRVFETVFDALTTFDGEPMQAPFRLGNVLRRITALYAPTAKLKGLELVLDYAPELSNLELEGNLEGLYRTLSHLMSNAFKFTNQGSVTFKASMVSLDGENVELRFDIVDTGPGLPEELQKKVFDPFFRYAADQHRRSPGIGLGLALVQRTVASLGGTLGLGSCTDYGTHVYLTLPFRRLSAKPAPPIEAVQPVEPVRNGQLYELSSYRSGLDPSEIGRTLEHLGK